MAMCDALSCTPSDVKAGSSTCPKRLRQKPQKATEEEEEEAAARRRTRGVINTRETRAKHGEQALFVALRLCAPSSPVFSISARHEAQKGEDGQRRRKQKAGWGWGWGWVGGGGGGQK
jgi:hypothetical protein